MCFSAKAYLGTMISRKEVVIEQTAGVNEAKICLKLVKKPIIFATPKLLQLSTYIPWCFPNITCLLGWPT